jgi:hypothetical protein
LSFYIFEKNNLQIFDELVLLVAKMLSCGDAKGRGGRLSYELFETTGLAQYEIENFENLW